MPTKRTKILATLGPASASPSTIEGLIRAGVDCFRLNFSHGTAAEHLERAAMVRTVAERLGRHTGLLADLQGPKIRIAGFAAGAVELEVGESFALDPKLGEMAGNSTEVGIGYPELGGDCRRGDRLLLDDGRIELEVEAITDGRVATRVRVGGRLSGNKGINLAGGGLSAAALTAKDRADIQTAVALGADFIAVSFPKDAADMEEARRLVERAGFRGRLVAKIERAECLSSDATLDALICASDLVMVARGDLGVEIGDAALVGVQKRIILRARQLNRLVITATQMMESMVASPTPTRAEVSDVANAVLDGTDAVMLSAETAVGQYPLKCIEAMTRIVIGAEREKITQTSQHRRGRQFERIDETIAMAAMYAANHMGNTRAIVSFTESGTTPVLMSRIRSGIPIYSLSRHREALRGLSLARGIYPYLLDFDAELGLQQTIEKSLALLKERGALVPGERILCTVGDSLGQSGQTNTLKVLTA
ncbi:MAG: pyruvate kinase [Cellvibrionales bacterium]|nr:pyruvate kinase [Cellvibrionales bacterium]